MKNKFQHFMTRELHHLDDSLSYAMEAICDEQGNESVLYLEVWDLLLEIKKELERRNEK